MLCYSYKVYSQAGQHQRNKHEQHTWLPASVSPLFISIYVKSLFFVITNVYSFSVTLLVFVIPCNFLTFMNPIFFLQLTFEIGLGFHHSFVVGYIFTYFGLALQFRSEYNQLHCWSCLNTELLASFTACL